MGIWNWLFGGDMAPATSDHHVVVAPMDINPATGLPMLGDCGGVDVCGNPYGMDLHQSSGHSSSGFGGGCDLGTSFGSDWPD